MLTRYQIDALNRRGIILYSVAKRIGIPEARVYRLLKGRSIPRPGELEALASALGLSMADISEATRPENDLGLTAADNPETTGPENKNPRTAVPVRG